MKGNKVQFNQQQHDAILAGLRLLQTSLDNRLVIPDDGVIGDILTNCGSHDGLTTDEIEELVGAMTTREAPPQKPRVLIVVSGGVAHPTFDDGVDVQVFDQDDYDAGPTETGCVPYNFADLAEPLGIPVAKTTAN